jgi:putative membrane protein
MMWNYGGWFGAVWMVIFWVGALLLIAWLLRQVGSRSSDASRAVEILEERDVRGEIDATEFDSRMRDMRQ